MKVFISKLACCLPAPLVVALKMKLPFYQIADYRRYVECVSGKSGIEIGGPSLLFKTKLPLYQKIKELDGVNFSTNTIWEGHIESGEKYDFWPGKKGTQYVSDGVDLSGIESEKYDFLLSSNCLEHIANPLKALSEWKRIIVSGGAFILVLPNKESNFDHRRPTTLFEHILDDFKMGVTEDDLSHLSEILSLHDLSLDPPAGDFECFKSRSMDNFNNRTLHHHVFDMKLIIKMLTFLDFEIIHKTETRINYYVLARKCD